MVSVSARIVEDRMRMLRVVGGRALVEERPATRRVAATGDCWIGGGEGYDRSEGWFRSVAEGGSHGESR